ncbi:MAG: flagellar basal body P-ring formation protein FlgA [Candidatus Sericytochromatia bacterium]|uniref:Flagella basal body P-ring formation protein FlgA n=1 Tax=Candidatus Tanganyikabacteria bacterium TaxID=2961651 RepID=A0A937X137_9BACT|nr:flagellar basal body P-ring formation protein FlgA [Candidatus Tanganyikabacteria bacterium]
MPSKKTRAVAAVAAASVLVLAAPALALTEQDCVDFVRNQAALMYRVPLADVSVKWEGPRLADITNRVPKEGTLSLIGNQYRLAGTMPVPLQVFEKGAKVATIYPRLSINVQQEVAVATGRITRGRVIDGSVIRIEKRPATQINGQPFTSIEGLIGATSRVDIPAGAILSGVMVEVPPVIRSGANVSVRVNVGGLSIYSSGQVLQDGRPGQLVRVLNVKSQKEFLAKVAGPEVVEVDVEPDNGEGN